jgi:hypothetical protein
VAYGQNQDLIGLAQVPIIANRAPTVNDRAEVGTIWTYRTANQVWILASIIANVSTWVNVGGGAGVFTSILVTPGTSHFESTTNVAGAITLSTNGGTAETILLSNEQGTAADSIELVSTVGGITINAGDALTIAAGANSSLTMAGNTDFELSSIGGQISIEGGEVGGNGVVITATSATGDVDISAGDTVIISSTTVDGSIFLKAREVTTNLYAANFDGSFIGVATQTGVVLLGNADVDIVITCDAVTANSGVLVTATNSGGALAQVSVIRTQVAANTLTVTVYNNSIATALNTDLVITFMVLAQ